MRSRLVEDILIFEKRAADADLLAKMRKFGGTPNPGQTCQESYAEVVNACLHNRSMAKRAREELVLFDNGSKQLVSCIVCCNAVFWYS